MLVDTILIWWRVCELVLWTDVYGVLTLAGPVLPLIRTLEWSSALNELYVVVEEEESNSDDANEGRPQDGQIHTPLESFIDS